MRHNQVGENRSQHNDSPPSKSLARIRSKYPTLAASEAHVATWVLKQSESIMRLSMAQVAQACSVSDTTVLRFCRNTGLGVAREDRAEAIASRIAQDTIIDALYVIMAWQNLETATRNEKLIWDALLKKCSRKCLQVVQCLGYRLNLNKGGNTEEKH